MPSHPGKARLADVFQECGPCRRRIGQLAGKCAKQAEHELACREGGWRFGPARFRPLRAGRRVFIQFEKTLERLKVLGGFARVVDDQVSAAMDPFQDRRSHRRIKCREVVARNSDKIEPAEINPRMRQAVRRDHFRKRGRVRRSHLSESNRVVWAAGRRDVIRAIHRPGGDHEHRRGRLGAEHRRAADDSEVRWQLALLVVDAKYPLLERRERNGKRETGGRVLFHANDPLDRRPMRPVGGGDFDQQ